MSVSSRDPGAAKGASDRCSNTRGTSLASTLPARRERDGGEDGDQLGVGEPVLDVQRQVAGQAFDPAPLAGGQLAAFEVECVAAVVGLDAFDDDASPLGGACRSGRRPGPWRVPACRFRSGAFGGQRRQQRAPHLQARRTRDASRSFSGVDCWTAMPGSGGHGCGSRPADLELIG